MKLDAINLTTYRWMERMRHERWQGRQQNPANPRICIRQEVWASWMEAGKKNNQINPWIVANNEVKRD